MKGSDAKVHPAVCFARDGKIHQAVRTYPNFGEAECGDIVRGPFVWVASGLLSDCRKYALEQLGSAELSRYPSCERCFGAGADGRP